MSKVEMMDGGCAPFSSLKCPECSDRWLHQDEVEAFFRKAEDAGTGLHLSANSTGIITGTNMERNPSSRRDGILIHFWCETCLTESNRHTLRIYQHKGETILEWVTK